MDAILHKAGGIHFDFFLNTLVASLHDNCPCLALQNMGFIDGLTLLTGMFSKEGSYH